MWIKSPWPFCCCSFFSFIIIIYFWFLVVVVILISSSSFSWNIINFVVVVVVGRMRFLKFQSWVLVIYFLLFFNSKNSNEKRIRERERREKIRLMKENLDEFFLLKMKTCKRRRKSVTQFWTSSSFILFSFFFLWQRYYIK